MLPRLNLPHQSWLKGMNHPFFGHFGNPSVVFNHGGLSRNRVRF
jgi:hypothetical protein